MGCHVLLQGIFLTQGLNLHFLLTGILHWQADSLSLVPPRFFWPSHLKTVPILCTVSTLPVVSLPAEYFYSIYIILKCHFHRWIYLSRRELHYLPTQIPGYRLTIMMSLLDTDTPQHQNGTWLAQIHQNNFSPLARINGSEKVSTRDLSYSVQDILLDTNVQLRVQCLEREEKRRKDFSFVLNSAVYTYEVWNCYSHLAANRAVLLLPFQIVCHLFPFLVLLW